MWSVEAWEKIKFYFPDTSNRSRILVMTRQHQLVDYFASSAVAVDLLGDEDSWKLFCDKAFGQEGFPPELEEAGRKIAKKCKGLPLAISVLRGLLRKSPRTQEYWEEIAQDKSLIPQDSGNESNKVLSLLYTSYKHLPVCMKPCFLYLGLFPEDRLIDMSHLIKLWIAEGFIKPKANQTQEEVAESYVKELVDRNLLLVYRLRPNKKFWTCFLHDLVRELCIRIAEKEDFYCVLRDVGGERHFIVDQRSASSYPSEPQTTSEPPPSLYRPLLFEGERASPFKSRLVRVLVSPVVPISEEVNLRFLSDHNYPFLSSSFGPLKLPPTISLFWSLQTILLSNTRWFDVSLPDIWKMPQLRHIDISPVNLPDPPPTGDAIVLRNLQTLKRVQSLKLSEEVCKRIPNVKNLEINNISHAEDWDVGCFNKLETLCCSFNITVALKNLTLPESLKELSLRGCLLPWSRMATIGQLPRLQILHLCDRAMVGEEWNLGVEERFRSLKYLRIERCVLIRWDADASNFPVLETLCLKRLRKLEEIPSGIGDIPTLELMEVCVCSKAAAMSAIKIQEEQQSLENLDLKVQVIFA